MSIYLDPYDPTVPKINKTNVLQFDKIIRFDISNDFKNHNKENNVGYIPLSLSISREKVQNVEQVYGIIAILKPLLTQICKTKVTDIEIFEGEEYILNPITEFGISVYINPLYSESIYSQINIDKLIGYTLLLEHAISRYIVEKEDLENVKYVNNIAVVPIEYTKFDSIHYEKIQNFEFTLQNYIQEGIFGYTFSPFDSDDYEYVRQLCKMFDIRLLDDKDFSTWILQTDIDSSLYMFGNFALFLSEAPEKEQNFQTRLPLLPEIWIRNNIPLIKLGQFPKFSFKILNENNDYNRRYGEVNIKYVMKYCALISFARLSDKHSIIKPFIYSVEVNEDLSISLQIPSIQLLKEFKNIFSEMFLNSGYSIERANNLEESIIKRYIIQSVDADSYPIIFLESREENSIHNLENSYLIVHRSPLANNYPSPFIFDKENVKKHGEGLLEKMKKFYKKCHDNIEPVTLENIDKMSLLELFSLIPITENKITYCYNKETLIQLERNPITRNPLSDEVLDKIEKLEYGLRGYFDVGVLYGLYSNINFKIKDKLEDVGLTRITRIPVEKEWRELYGNLFLIQVIFKDGTESDLFEISLPTINLEKIDELRTYVEKLWKEGFFLSNWEIFLLQNNYSSFFININNDILLNAKDSIFDGNTALNYLKFKYLEYL